jgi:hypothetical protein
MPSLNFKFVNKVKDMSFETFLDDVEDNTHGFERFTIGGVGRTYASRVNSQIKEKFGFTDADVDVTDNSAHSFFKNYITWKIPYPTDDHNYINCASSP